MRRPMSIMRAGDDWIEILYKTVGQGLTLLSHKRPGDVISVLGPIGKPFTLDPARPNALLIGGGVGIPPMVFLADAMRHDERFRPAAILGSEIPFPVRSRGLGAAVRRAPTMTSTAACRCSRSGASRPGLPRCRATTAASKATSPTLRARWLASVDDGNARRDDDLHLRTDAHAQSGRCTGPGVRRRLRGIAGRIYGLRGRGLCRLRRSRRIARRSRHAAGLRRWTGLRRTYRRLGRSPVRPAGGLASTCYVVFLKRGPVSASTAHQPPWRSS
jgi:hypothetical protein